MATQIKKSVTGPLTANATDAPGVEFTGPQGSIVKLALADLSADMVTRLAVHGLAQKIGDSYAGASEEGDPLAASVAWIGETVAQLKAGEWRVASVGGGPRASLLAKALARATGNTLEEAVGVIDLLPDEDKDGQPGKKTLRKALKAIMDEISAEEAIARADKSKSKAGDVAGLSALFGAGLKTN